MCGDRRRYAEVGRWDNAEINRNEPISILVFHDRHGQGGCFARLNQWGRYKVQEKNVGGLFGELDVLTER